MEIILVCILILIPLGWLGLNRIYNLGYKNGVKEALYQYIYDYEPGEFEKLEGSIRVNKESLEAEINFFNFHNSKDESVLIFTQKEIENTTDENELNKLKNFLVSQIESNNEFQEKHKSDVRKYKDRIRELEQTLTEKKRSCPDEFDEEIVKKTHYREFLEIGVKKARNNGYLSKEDYDELMKIANK